MVPKPCILPQSIEMYQAMIRRLIENHLSKYDIVTDHNNRLTGFLGEQSVMNFHLDPILNSTDFRIYHDLRFLYKNYYFQIDILILCAYFALVIEVKNRVIDWHFDKVTHQTTFNHNGKVKRTNNPILQAKLQAFKLKEWLKEHNISGLPIQYLFVNAHEQANIFITDDNPFKWNACNSELLLDRIEQLFNHFKIEMLDEKELRKVNKILLSNHTPEIPDLFKKYGLSKKEILPGVHCPNCNTLPMFYHAGKWKCSKCGIESKTVFMNSINDYFLLMNPTITNSAARKFLQIHSAKTMHHLFKIMNLPSTGEFRHRIYHMPSK